MESSFYIICIIFKLTYIVYIDALIQVQLTEVHQKTHPRASSRGPTLKV